jgi:hypothetical protein
MRLIKIALLGVTVVLASCRAAPNLSQNSPNQTTASSPNVQQLPPQQAVISPSPPQQNTTLPNGKLPPPPKGQWLYIDQTQDGSIIASIDQGSASGFWVRQQMQDSVGFLYTKADCQKGTIEFTWGERYSSDGKLIQSTPISSEPQGFLSGSSWGSILSRVCRQ